MTDVADVVDVVDGGDVHDGDDRDRDGDGDGDGDSDDDGGDDDDEDGNVTVVDGEERSVGPGPAHWGRAERTRASAPMLSACLCAPAICPRTSSIGSSRPTKRCEPASRATGSVGVTWCKSSQGCIAGADAPSERRTSSPRTSDVSRAPSPPG
ncbi:MAG: hypothetical protein L0G94_19495 [Brachybacterium sp.]|nr:hypothetical protein [Brachybacterium sp.]